MPPAVLSGQAVPGPRLVLLMRAIPNNEVLEQDFLAMPGRQPVDPLVSYSAESEVTLYANPFGQMDYDEMSAA